MLISNNYLPFIRALHSFAQNINIGIIGEKTMSGAIRKIGKIVAFPVFIGLWIIGWSLYSKGDNAQVSNKNRKIIWINSKTYKKEA
ncbi:MAG: hypothetical protein IAX21_10185 [Candidatus Bathyarchaeota archaeon]|nr:hypothetical protein [Candidatus Bathyarchaeum tardum]WGM88756.1 MAG: hypothetical protein NUK63_07490 [Candidatus Bathyarchaeum tardum]WNZ28990.1 MAG: hypothetical protein IAX21_10185 [Candidatus Bathyarchaeota archaeon]